MWCNEKASVLANAPLLVRVLPNAAHGTLKTSATTSWHEALGCGLLFSQITMRHLPFGEEPYIIIQPACHVLPFHSVRAVMVWPLTGKRNDEASRLKSVRAGQVELRTWHLLEFHESLDCRDQRCGHLRTWLSGGVSS